MHPVVPGIALRMSNRLGKKIADPVSTSDTRPVANGSIWKHQKTKQRSPFVTVLTVCALPLTFVWFLARFALDTHDETKR